MALPGGARDRCDLTVVWQIRDGKQGHDNQSTGLVRALHRHTEIETVRLDPPARFPRALAAAWHTYRTARLGQHPDPDILVGAGHGTHLSLLAAQRARGGRTIVLMNPSAPRGWFDLVIVPSHDEVEPGSNTLVTRGVLNRLSPSEHRDPRRGLFLIGGPSRHHDWSCRGLVEQVRAVLSAERSSTWLAVGSRRTPCDTLAALREIGDETLSVVAFDDADADWLPSQLAPASRVWVTEDSVSMVYESLTVGAATGILEVPARGFGARTRSRVLRGLDSLIEDGWVTPFDRWRNGASLEPAPAPLDEARRCARWIWEHWLSNRD